MPSCSGLIATDLRLQLRLQPGRRAQGLGQSLARQYAGVGDDVAAGPLQLRANPDVYHAPYEYSVPGVEEDYLPQTLPRPATAGPLDPVMA